MRENAGKLVDADGAYLVHIERGIGIRTCAKGIHAHDGDYAEA